MRAERGPLIQAPELVGRLARALGVRHHHVAPTLGHEVVPVVIMHDATRESFSTQAQTYRIFLTGPTLVAADIAQCSLSNPLGSSIVARVSHIWLSWSSSATKRWGCSLTSRSNAVGAVNVHGTATDYIGPQLAPPSAAYPLNSVCFLNVGEAAVPFTDMSWGIFRHNSPIGELGGVAFDNVVLQPGTQFVWGNFDPGAVGDLFDFGIEFVESPIQLKPPAGTF
jgi:hypothetical protein